MVYSDFIFAKDMLYFFYLSFFWGGLCRLRNSVTFRSSMVFSNNITKHSKICFQAIAIGYSWINATHIPHDKYLTACYNNTNIEKNYEILTPKCKWKKEIYEKKTAIAYTPTTQMEMEMEMSANKKCK